MPIDHRAIAQLAARQHGAFSHAQASAAGATRSSLQTAVSSGRWQRPVRGVYLLAGHPPSAEQRAMIASLARPDGVIGGLSAAALAGWTPAAPPLPVLVVPPGSSVRLPIARARRAVVAPDQRGRIGAIPTTSPARTLVDLAHELGPARLSKIVDAAMHDRATSAAAVLDQVERAPRLGGARAESLVALLEPWRAQIRPGSPAEARLRRLIVAWGYPAPERQIRIRDEHGRIVARTDGGWTSMRIALEYDSRDVHGPSHWAHDGARHALVAALGWQVLHADAADLRPGERAFRDALAAAWSRALLAGRVPSSSA